MSVTIYTDKGNFKGRKLDSCIRTNFGEKAFISYWESPEDHPGTVGHISVPVNKSGAYESLAIVEKIVERKTYVAPPSRQQRWNNAISQMQDAISEARDVEEVYDSAESCEDCSEVTGTCDEHDEEALQQALDDATSKWEDGANELEELQGEYQDWLDNLPEAFQYDSPVGDKLQAVIDLSFERVEFTLENVSQDLSDAESYVSEYEDADLPLGFGRD